jgi:hypothetical protein
MKQPYLGVLTCVLPRLIALLFFLHFSEFEASAQDNRKKNPDSEYHQKSPKNAETAHSDELLAQFVGRIVKLQEMFSQSGIQTPPKKMVKLITTRCPNIPLPQNGWPDAKQLKASFSVNMEQGQTYLDLLMSLYKDVKNSTQK